jgi:aspartate/methionine/tyrosine aminotransferase
MFSTRVPPSLEANRIAQAVRRARAAARPLVDLTITNPTMAGFEYPASMLDGMASASGLTYAPQPFGVAEARRAVACDYARRGIPASPERIVLTASTSEAYSLLFKLLCAPDGDAVMVPVPSYPLFDHLTALDGVRAIPYPLDYHGRWTLAQDDLEERWTPAVRAVLAVSPNNPTGSVLSAGELETLSSFCAERQAALIVDEVFADYAPLTGVAGPSVDSVSITQCSRGPTPARSRAAPAYALRASPRSRRSLGGGGTTRRARAAGATLTFRLGGLSKSAGLPQVKLGWMLIDGPDDLVRGAMERLEVICDAYLSVSTPVQAAATTLIEAGALVRAQILARVRANYRVLLKAVARHPAIEVLHADAGWSAVLRVPSTRSEEDFVVDLLELDGVLVHPGFFFDFPHEAFIIVSLLPEPQVFTDGIRRVLERADA